jgi:arylsulfatase A-like enzyme|tara:strand:+ start:827 stop:2278 length:1452 start_codon:yes stop_codon:yes gene_type:complete
MASRSAEQPNLLFVLTDDQGAWAMGCAGNSEIRSPNLDRLAAEGIRFDNFFCASPVCSPARASILTGRIPSQHGVHDFLHWQADSGAGGLNKKVPADNVQFLAGQPTYAEILGRAGYDTCLSGKWHLGDGLEPRSGFQTWNPMPYGASEYFKAPVVENGELVTHEGDYSSDLFTDNALKFLERQVGDAKPFCLNVHFTAPHAPWGRRQHPREIWNDYYDNCPFASVPGHEEPLPIGFHAQPIDEEGRRRSLAGYFAAIQGMDRNVGRLLDWLDDNDLASNTLVVFMSDNGMNMGHHGLYGKGNATWPQNMFDTSVKVPCLIRRPGHVPENQINTHLLSQYDWLPTLLEYVGLSAGLPNGLPGRSFAPLLTGDELQERESIYVFDEYGPVRMIRSREWKLVWRYPAGAHELYNVIEDPGELANLFNRPGHRDRISSMLGDLEGWFERYVDPQLDGTKLAITGRGQSDHATKKGAFAYRFPWLDQ